MFYVSALFNSIVTWTCAGRPRNPDFYSRHRECLFYFPQRIEEVWGPTQWVLLALFRGRGRGVHEAVHSPVCGAEFK